MVPPKSETSFLSEVTNPSVYCLFIIFALGDGLVNYFIKPESTLAFTLFGFVLWLLGSNFIWPSLISSSEFSLTFLATYYLSLVIVFFPYYKAVDLRKYYLSLGSGSTYTSIILFGYIIYCHAYLPAKRKPLLL